MAASIRRLSRRVQIIIIYFASHEHIIPKFKSDNVEVKKISGDHAGDQKISTIRIGDGRIFLYCYAKFISRNHW